MITPEPAPFVTYWRAKLPVTVPSVAISTTLSAVFLTMSEVVVAETEEVFVTLPELT